MIGNSLNFRGSVSPKLPNSRIPNEPLFPPCLHQITHSLTKSLCIHTTNQRGTAQQFCYAIVGPMTWPNSLFLAFFILMQCFWPSRIPHGCPLMLLSNVDPGAFRLLTHNLWYANIVSLAFISIGEFICFFWWGWGEIKEKILLTRREEYYKEHGEHYRNWSKALRHTQHSPKIPNKAFHKKSAIRLLESQIA